MPLQASLWELAQITGADLSKTSAPHPDIKKIYGLTTDSREVTPGSVFLALRGERFDGHQFVGQAIAQGAVAAVVDAPISAAVPCLVVPDTLKAYQAIARWWRQHLGVPLVAITGSVGKTTTKELIAAALSAHGPVLKTYGNYNNEIGVPKTLLALEPEHRYGVVEMGMRGPGEIALLTQIALPNVAVITNVGTAHIERLGSEQAIAAAKCELLAHLSPQGIAVLNHDNPRLMATAAGVWSGPQITFGLEGGDIHGHLEGETLIVNDVRLPLPLPGRHNALNYLAAIAVMQAFDLDWTVLKAGLTVDLPSGRARRLALPPDLLLLDETYNAGAESMTAALHLLKETPGQRHIAVLGTMKELGAQSVPLHEQVGNVVRHLGIDRLLVIADPLEAAALKRGASPVATELFDDQRALGDYLKTHLQAGDRVLFKASRAVGLEQVVAAVVTHFTVPSTEKGDSGSSP